MLRELHLRSGEERIARMGRSELPQVKRQIGLQLQMLERAVAAPEDSPLRKPRPGRQCLKACAFTSSCPIPGEQRGLGAVDSDEDADEQFARFLTVDALRQQLRDRLKARFEESGYVATAPDGSELRWKYAADGKRTFGPCQPDDPRSVVEAEVS